MAAHEDLDRTEILVTRLPGLAPDGEPSFGTGVELGRYRLDALLGRGGMGEVYRAEQLEPVRRTVALKLLRARRMEARHLAYFEVERQMLAQMRHPAIAQIYDAGATAEGFPFFAMEYIEGSPVTEFCRQRRLPLRERIELFVRICEGVQHAHQKGVIHRDLKPGNLLVAEVDGRPLPKIIDFGIATAATRALGDGEHERAGTPEYMSPEQAGADPAGIDTRSDVYSLGVILYELLAGQRPSIAGETRQASQQTLPLPSEKLATLPPQQADDIARACGTRAAGLQRLLRGELDWVVARAMRHERAERYASAAELAEDLRRFLDGRPLQAVPASRRYVWGKFVRRHRSALAAAAAVLLALLGGLGLSLYGLAQARTQRAIAEQRSGELGRVVSFQQSMLESMDMPLLGARMGQELRRQVAAAAPGEQARFDSLLARADTTDAARRLVDAALLDSAESAIDRDFADDPRLASDLRESIARVQASLGLHAKAATALGKVADYRSGAFGAAASETLRARQAQVQALIESNERERAAAQLERALPHAATLPGNDPVRVRLELAQAQLVSASGDRAAGKALRQALLERLVAQHGERDPMVLEVRNDLAASQRALGEMQEARANMESVLATRRETLGADHEDTLNAQGNLAVLRMMGGEKKGALELQRELAALRVARLGNEHPVSLYTRATLGAMLADSGNAGDALPLLQSVLEASERVLGAEHSDTVRIRLNLATTHARLHDYAAALPLERQVLEVRGRRQGMQHPDTLSILINHAGTLHRAGRSAETLKLLHDAAPVARQVLGNKHPQTHRMLLIRAEALMALGQREAALAVHRERVALLQRVLGEQHHDTLQAIWQMSAAYRKVGHVAQADSLHQRHLVPLLEARPGTLTEPQQALADAIRSGRDPLN
ncbi:protein kinase domain-containing protein [Pseudoxanthomonas mexicana]|uniref:serine/threonine-protein kinase n=1 Tax=Pseudoxanthomonas mexicana TaxID=128785 RepID=UPI00398A8F7D